MSSRPAADRERLSEAARSFRVSLDAAQRGAACFELDDEGARADWDYRPRERPGLALGGLSPSQAVLLHRLIGASCSLVGQGQVNAVIALEPLLARMEPWNPDRDASTYAVSLFGEPEHDRWAWRFEGHHVSLNVTVAPMGVRSTPAVLGANPAAVPGALGPVSRPLAREEDLARALLRTLGPRMRRRAVVSDAAPDDILTSNDRRVGEAEAWGASVGDFDSRSRARLRDLLAAFAARLPESVAERELGRLGGRDAERLWFAWAGSPDPGGRWYYRIAGPGLLIEADCTQDDGNHLHTVWRDPGGDFGRDLLGEHLVRDHGMTGFDARPRNHA